jgi:hypothetical protein
MALSWVLVDEAASVAKVGADSLAHTARRSPSRVIQKTLFPPRNFGPKAAILFHFPQTAKNVEDG